LARPLERLVGRWGSAAAHGLAVGVAFAVITGLHIVAGELAPKGIALQHPEATTLWIVRPLQLFYLVFRWPITALNTVGNGVLRLMGLRPATGQEMVHSADELGLLVKASQRAGLVEESEARIAARAFQFADLTAADLMTPRTEVESIPIGIAREDLLRSLATTRHSRLLVYEGLLDNILGVIHVRDLVRTSHNLTGRSTFARSSTPFSPCPRVEGPTTCLRTCERRGALWRSWSMSTGAPPGSSPSET
jgi:putative hemolysin